ncbi:MAG TPA: hypothetical protein VGZ73_25360 [Bryobacteraceae bacterium]|nr:hypothetical protein [Bryobacteraceae bacterium]
MRKKLVLTALVASAGLMAQPPEGPRSRMGFGPGPMGPGGPQMGRAVTGAPYSAVEVRTEQQVLPGGNTIQRQMQTTINRDSQGRMRVETEIAQPGQTPVKRITIHDPVAGVVHELDPQNRSARSMPTRGAGNRPAGMSPRNPKGAPRPVDPNVKTEDLGTQSINGVPATGTRTTHTIPAGAIGNAQPIETVHERWVSTDLQVPVLVKTTDPRHGTTVTQLTNINRAEPDSSLFTVPSDYTVTRIGPGGPGGRGRPFRGGQVN